MVITDPVVDAVRETDVKEAPSASIAPIVTSAPSAAVTVTDVKAAAAAVAPDAVTVISELSSPPAVAVIDVSKSAVARNDDPAPKLICAFVADVVNSTV
jgi:hypothetical protein